MARVFPIVWQTENERLRLVVVRSFMRDPLAIAPERLLSRPGELPLIARAHPLVLRPTPDGEDAVFFDTDFADQPTDAGAPISTPDARLGAGTEQRLRALTLFAQEEARTAAMTADLVTHGCLMEWALPFPETVRERLIAMPLMVLRSDLAPSLLRELALRHAHPLVSLLGAHRLSLFRTAPLIKQAEQDLSAERVEA